MGVKGPFLARVLLLEQLIMFQIQVSSVNLCDTKCLRQRSSLINIIKILSFPEEKEEEITS